MNFAAEHEIKLADSKQKNKDEKTKFSALKIAVKLKNCNYHLQKLQRNVTL